MFAFQDFVENFGGVWKFIYIWVFIGFCKKGVKILKYIWEIVENFRVLFKVCENVNIDMI